MNQVAMNAIETTSADDDRRWRRRQHAWLLAASLAVLAVAIASSVDGETSVTVRGLNVPLPPTCTWNRFTGYPCAGCGLTRSFVALAAGDVPRAWHFNPAGLLLFAALMFQYPYRIGQIWRLSRGRDEWQLRGTTIFWWIVLVALVTQWIVRLVFYA
jgi:hypothetical protein